MTQRSPLYDTDSPVIYFCSELFPRYPGLPMRKTQSTVGPLKGGGPPAALVSPYCLSPQVIVRAIHITTKDLRLTLQFIA